MPQNISGRVENKKKVIAGTNLSSVETNTTNTLNLDASLTGISNINTYEANVLTLNNNSLT